jgi:peptide/nickel transport system substrate-binding protein
LNPLLDDNNQPDKDVDRLIFSGLIKFDSRGMPEPDLAESIRSSQDGVIYNVTLKEDLLWHDGESITTSDIAFTVDLLKEGEGFIAEDLVAFWNEIKLVIIDDLNMQFVLPEAFAPFQDYLAFGILPEHLLGGLSIAQIAESDFNLQPVGSGPFEFSELVVEDDFITGLKLIAFEEYYGEGPFLNEINFRYYSDTTSAFQAYLDQYVQGISQISDSQLPMVLSDENLSLYTGRLPEMSMVLFNLNDNGVSFFQDKNIRRALLLGLNRQRLVNEIFNGQAIIANGVIFPDNWAYLETLTPVDFNPEQSAMLLKEAGYVISGEENPIREKDGTRLQFVLSYPDDELHRQIAEFIQESWKELSVDIILEGVPADIFISDKLEPRAFQAALVDISLSSTPDPDPYPFWD